MPEREQKKKQTTTREAEVVEEAVPASGEQAEKLKAELDDLLDSIDEVLEEHAEDFVRGYVQKGGE